ncbi:MAG TPA: hypothetical protein H9796_11620 [Candidatus Butyricimonas faecavium]|nr:hypothetical protein [Candidatus Butyricimonas faecavium]
MLKKYLLYGIYGCLLTLGACNKDEEAVSPSYLDRNWFVISDKPGEFNQLAYSIYTETGIPIFVNDTLGEENYATDAEGRPIYRTETFNLSYILFGSTVEQSSAGTTRYIVQSSDTVAMIKAATLLRDRVIPFLPKTGEYRPKCYFMVDSLNDYCVVATWLGYDYVELPNEPAYAAMKGVVVGQLCDINNMDDAAIDLWCGRIIAVKIAKWLTNDEVIDLSDWYAITDEGKKSGSYYGQDYDSYYDEFEYNMLDSAGMFGWYAENEQYRCTYEQERDVFEYVARVYAYRGKEEEFLSEYAGKDKVCRKFNLMQEYVTKFEEKFNIKIK